MLRLPITTGEYLTQSGTQAMVDEVHSAAVFGHVGTQEVIWTSWGETGNECNNLIKLCVSVPVGRHKLQPITMEIP